MKVLCIALIGCLAGCAPMTPDQRYEQYKSNQAIEWANARSQYQPPPQPAPAPYHYMLPTQQYNQPQPPQYQPYQQQGAVAAWTGSQKFVQTVTGRPGVECQYQYAGQYFTRVFAASCPSSVQVQ